MEELPGADLPVTQRRQWSPPCLCTHEDPGEREGGAGQSRLDPRGQSRLSEQLLQETPKLTYHFSFGSRHAWVAPDTLGTLSRQKKDSVGNIKTHFMIPSLTPTLILHNAPLRQAAESMSHKGDTEAQRWGGTCQGLSK